MSCVSEVKSFRFCVRSTEDTLKLKKHPSEPVHTQGIIIIVRAQSQWLCRECINRSTPSLQAPLLYFTSSLISTSGELPCYETFLVLDLINFVSTCYVGVWVNTHNYDSINTRLKFNNELDDLIKEAANMASLNVSTARDHTEKDDSSDATVKYSKADCDHSASAAVFCTRYSKE